jgi:hypothetical protein
VSITPIEIGAFVLCALGTVHCLREMLLAVAELEQK